MEKMRIDARRNVENWRWEEAPVICAGGTEVVALVVFATEVVDEELVTPPPTADVALVLEIGAGAVLVFADA
jgi:hypothetical protein